MIIKNLWNYIQFSHHPMTISQSVPEQLSWNSELKNFVNFLKLSKRTTLLEKYEPTDKRWIESTEIRKKEKERILAPQLSSIYKLSMTSVAWNISIGQIGLSVWLRSLPAPAHLLISWIWETEESPWFLATTKTISVISVLLILIPKHSS